MKLSQTPVSIQRQRGVALIIAILAVTLASIAAVAMASRQQVDIRRTENILNLQQTAMYLYGGERWAARILKDDMQKNQTDSLHDQWATKLPPIPVEGGQISGFIQDQQGLFNVNSLILSANRGLARQRYERLLENLEIDKALADTLIDWLDSDVNVTLPGGAEDNEYLGDTERPYRTANRPLQHISELLLIKGYTWEVYQKLRPFVSAINAPTSINVNTAPQAVIMALANNLNDAEVEDLVKSREKQAFDKLNEFTGHRAFNGKGLSPEGLSVASQHFLLTTQVMIGRARQQVESLLFRDNGGLVIVRLRQPVEH